MDKKTLYFASILVLFHCLFLAVAQADFNPEKWRYFKEIQIADAPSIGQLVEVALDRDIFNSAQNDLSDLRVIDAEGNEVPYKIIIEKGAFSEINIYPVKILNNSFVPGEYNIFIIDFGHSGFFNSSLKILTSSENFRRQVEISGSDDMQSWHVLKTDGYIYDYTDRRGNFKAQDTTLNYPENTYRYLRVKIFSGGESSLTINGAQVSKITREAAKEASFSFPYESFERDGGKVSGVIVDMGKKGWPTGNILLSSPDVNFNREVRIYESNDKNVWRQLGQGYIFNYNTPKFKGGNMSLSYSESNSRYLKIEIYNGDNQPISISGLSIKTILRNIVFQYSKRTNYKIYYGNDQARFPEYDLEKFLHYLDTGNRAVASLLIEQKNPFYKAEIPPPPVSERIPFLLPGVLIFTIIILGFFVYRFFKKIGHAN